MSTHLIFKRAKKLYCADNGLVNAVTYKFSQNSGKLLENLVFTELHKSGVEQLCFHNAQKECDFVVQKDGQLKAMQVCFQLTPENRDREIAGLKLAMQTFSIEQGVIITYDQQETLEDGIKVVPFWEHFSGT